MIEVLDPPAEPAQGGDGLDRLLEERVRDGVALAGLEEACREIGRDPASIGRSAGIIVEPTDITGAAEALAIPVGGSAGEIADELRAFRAGGFTQIEILLWPRTLTALEAMAPVLDLLEAD